MSDEEEIEGQDDETVSWGDYPLDNLLIRSENRTIYDIIRRIRKNQFIMDPEFQRDFIWDEQKQSKLVESIVLRIPLPVFYLAENDEGKMVVVDGLQRLSTFSRFLDNKLRLKLPDRSELNKKTFEELTTKIQNRVEDCNLTLYVIDSTVPERARLDIFERVNGGVPLTRQQMRNCLYMGEGTRFLKKEAETEIFKRATGESLGTKLMRDREFVNRFCAFQLLDINKYSGDMDDFLAKCLRKMNDMGTAELSRLSADFRRSLDNNFALFDRHAFRKSILNENEGRSVLNAAFWDVMTTGLSRVDRSKTDLLADTIRSSIKDLLNNEEFNKAISHSTGNTKWVHKRFNMVQKMQCEVFGAISH